MTKQDFLKRRWVADGAMATRLFGKGAPRGRPVEELNVTQPELVRQVHREYLDAGAQILRTNTFRRNAANAAGVQLAREVAGAAALVAGVIGPDAPDVLREYAAALQGVDLYILETFRDVGALRQAIEAVRAAAGVDAIVVAQVSVERNGKLVGGSLAELNTLDADVVGFNCSFGPAAVKLAFDELRSVTNKPMSAFPSVDDEAGWAMNFWNAGARIVGACCGSTPEHIREIRSTLDSQWRPT
jgi:homocysteine S-methyltransferase